MSEPLVDRLASIGSASLLRVITAKHGRRQILLREGVPQDVIDELYGPSRDMPRRAIFTHAYRRALDDERDARVEAAARAKWSLLTGTEDLGPTKFSDLRQEPGTGAIDYRRLRHWPSNSPAISEERLRATPQRIVPTLPQ